MRTGMFGLLVLGVYASFASREAAATSSVFTPPLGAASTSTYVCEVVNHSGDTQSVTIRIKDDTGATIASDLIAIQTLRARTVTATGGGDVVYCQAETDTNAHADDLRVNLYVQDSNSLPVTAVEGSRVGISSGANITTAGLQTVANERLECYVVNTHTSAA